MPNPGSFHGSRKDFLLGEKAVYSRGVVEGQAAEALALIQRRYFKHYPPDLDDDKEPSDEHLASVDDDGADPETSEPDQDKLTPEEYSLAMLAMLTRQKKIQFKKAQIKRWLIYQHVKDNDVHPKKSKSYNPYSAYIAKISGKEIQKPRLRTAVNVWRKEHREEIEELAKTRSEREGITKSGLAALRDSIARDLFQKLPTDKQQRWGEVAQSQHAEAVLQWKADVENGASTAPEDRQRSIQAVVHFVQPVLDAVCAATGWKASFFAGGPEPAQNGKLNMISVHSGTTSGAVKMTFGRSERKEIKKHFIPMYGNFLQKCYTPEECRMRTLFDDGFVSMAETDLENPDAAIHSIGIDATVESRPPSDLPAAPARLSQASSQLNVSTNNVFMSNNTALSESTTSSLPSISEPATASSPQDSTNPFPFDLRGISETPASPVTHQPSLPPTPLHSPPPSPARLSFVSPPVAPVVEPIAEGDTVSMGGAHPSSNFSTSTRVPSAAWDIISNAISTPITAISPPTPACVITNENAAVEAPPSHRCAIRSAKKTGKSDVNVASVAEPSEPSVSGRRSSRLADLQKTVEPISSAPAKNLKKGPAKRARDVLAEVRPVNNVPAAKRARVARKTPGQAAKKGRGRKAA